MQRKHSHGDSTLDTANEATPNKEKKKKKKKKKEDGEGEDSTKVVTEEFMEVEQEAVSYIRPGV